MSREPRTDVVTSAEQFCSLAADAPVGARVPVEVRTRIDCPFAAYRRFRSDDPGSFYLETTGGQEGWGYLGADPVDWLVVRPADVGPDGDWESSLSAVESLLDGERLVRGGCEVPYPCGAVGWLSYDVAREIESLPDTTEDDRGLPRLQFGVYDAAVSWREPKPDDGPVPVHVTVCPRVTADDAGDTDDVGEVYRRSLRRATEMINRLHHGERASPESPADGDAAVFETECGEAAYADRVRATKQYVREGDTFQANVSQRLVAPAAVHPLDVYGALRRLNPAPYSALLEFPGVDLVSASPELLLDVDGDDLLTEPIAGTRGRGNTAAADHALEADLLGDEKERAEHAMLVDLIRNDLGKVSAYGTVEVSEYRRVDRYSEVMHLVSAVVGERDGASVADCIEAVFPGGTITGAPKPRTMEIIDELEDTRRGPYTGAIGVLGFDERATLSMTIRTLVRTADRYHLRVGAGIVHDSDPVAEYRETLDKGRALIDAVDRALDDARVATDFADEREEI